MYWGFGYLQYRDTTDSVRFIGRFDPQDLRSLPVRRHGRSGRVAVRSTGRLLGSAGIRLDYTSYGHLEYQPSLRLLFTPSARQSTWIAASRALRLPSRFDRDIQFDGGSILWLAVTQSRLPEWDQKTLLQAKVRSVEAGYRFQSGQRWSIDAISFRRIPTADCMRT